MSLPISILKTSEQLPVDPLLVVTRAAIGLGLGLLMADKIKPSIRQAAAITLVSIGALAAAPRLVKMAFAQIKRLRAMSHPSISSSSEVLRAHCAAIAKEEAALREGGGKAGHERQRKMGRLPVRERIGHLLDKDSPFFEIGLWAAYKMYEQWGKIPAAGVVTGIGNVVGVPCMIIANDATVKAGAFFPQTAKKVIRAQRIAFECSLPIVYRVASA